MDEDGLHAQGASNSASVLPSGPPKACECVRGYIVPLHLGQGPDGAAHGLICHLDESHGNLGIQHVMMTNTQRCEQACDVGSQRISLAYVVKQQSCFASGGCHKMISK